ncbi:MAG: hypothetical protein IJF65_02280 [Clostridia bacterium]|nr:hypothetical protein [Clostridia bacterium]
MTRGQRTYVYRGSYAVVGGKNLDSERISVRAHVRLPASEIDPRTGMLLPPRPSAQRNPRSQRQAPGRTPAKAEETHYTPHSIPSRKPGLPLRRAMAMMAVLACTLGFITLLNYGQVTQQSKEVNLLRDEIVQVQKETEDKKLVLADMLKDTELWYNASQKLGMISSKGVSVVYLNAEKPQTMPITQADVPPARTGIYAALFGFLE